MLRWKLSHRRQTPIVSPLPPKEETGNINSWERILVTLLEACTLEDSRVSYFRFLPLVSCSLSLGFRVSCFRPRSTVSCFLCSASTVSSCFHRPASTVHGLLFPVSTLRGHPLFILSWTGFPQSTVMPINPPVLAGCGLVLRGFTVGCPQSPVSSVHGVHSSWFPLPPFTVHCLRFCVHGFQTVTCSFPSPLSPSSFSSAPTSDPRPSAWGCLRVFPRVSPRMFPQAPG